MHETQAALQASEERLDRAQEIAGIGSWEFDFRTGQHVWSKQMYRICGVPPDSFQPAPGSLDPFLHPEDREAFAAPLADLRSGVESGPIELRIIRPDGVQRIVRAEGRAIASEGGKVARVAGTMQDVTEQRLTERQLAQSQKLEALGNMTGGMAHDFNNILGIIIGNLDLLAETAGQNAEAEELRSEALEAALRGSELIRRLLAFARRQPLHSKVERVNTLVEGIFRLLQRMLGERVQLGLHLDPQVWPTVVDAAQLEAALTNLATNARDAMPQGGQLDIATRNVRLDEEYAARYPEVRPGDYVMIEVSDTGTGIPPEILARVFEPFFTTKEPGSGSGLGLSMVFGFMKQSGGHVSVYSEAGHGSTFRLYLPRARRAGVSAAERPAAIAAAGCGQTVLVVEDNDSLRGTAVKQLSALGYRVLAAADAETALAILEQDKAIALLFTDIVMPGELDGIALAERAMRLRPGLKTLFTSGFPEVRTRGKRLRGGRVRLLSKPYRRDQLSDAVREALDSAEPGSTKTGPAASALSIGESST